MKYPVSPDERKLGAQIRKVPIAEGDFTTAELVGINHIDIAKMPAWYLRQSSFEIGQDYSDITSTRIIFTTAPLRGKY